MAATLRNALARARARWPVTGQPVGVEQPPREPDGIPRLDWAAFEREFREYTERVGQPS